MAKGKLSSYSRRKPKKQKTVFGFKVGTPPKSDYQKKVLAGASVFKTGAGGKIATDSRGKISSFTSTPPQQITKEAPHHNIYKPVPKVKTVVVPRTGIAPPSVLGKQSGGTITTKAPHHDIYKPVPKVASSGSKQGTSFIRTRPKTKVPTVDAGSSSSGSQKFVVTPPVAKPTLLRGGGRSGQINKVVKSGYTGGEKEARKILSKGIGTGSSRATSTTSSGSSKPFKSLLKFLGVGSGTSGGTRGSYSGGTAGFTSSLSVPPVAQYSSSAKKTSGIKRTQHSSKPVSPKNYLVGSSKTLVSGQTRLKSPYTLNQIKTQDGTIKMKELTGTNTAGVKRNRTGKSSPITSSILNWWKQKGIDTQSQSNKNFMKAQKTLPKNFGRGSY